jgi:hypothetical protein
MQLAEAIKHATKTANQEQVEMVVTHDPYGENEKEMNYEFMPKGAEKIFHHQTVVQIIKPI